MLGWRSITAAMIALAVAVAPMGSAWAALRTVAPATHAPLTAEKTVVDGTMRSDAGTDMAAGTDMDAEMAMVDCEKMPSKPGKSDCPCCDTKSACPPDFCPFKIFKVFGFVYMHAASRVPAQLHLLPGEPQRPPDWIDSPQPPPPRA